MRSSASQTDARGIVGSLAVLIVLLISACTGEVLGVSEAHSAPSDVTDRGRQLIADYGCGSCHTIPGVPGADSMAGPPLIRFYQRAYIAGQLPNTPENLIRWIQDPQAVEPGTAMPDLGVTEEQASDIATYLLSQTQTNGVLGS